MTRVESRQIAVESALHDPSGPALLRPALPGVLRDFVELSKPRLNSLVLASTAVGFAMGVSASGAMWTGALLLHVLVGTALCAAAGSALNQWYERDVDALMRRTANRPLPRGRLSSSAALRFGAILGILGVVQLALFANHLAALVAFVTIILYALVYTPLKRVTSASTIVGAVPGGLPPLIGWAAATGGLEPGGWSLVLIIFVWQVPHFLAIAWMYRDEYAAAGMPVLPVIDADGRRTSIAMLSWSAMLLPASLGPAMLGISGPLYVVTAFALGVVQVGLALRLVIGGVAKPQAARGLFFYSIIYLPVLFVVMVIDAVVLPRLIS